MNNQYTGRWLPNMFAECLLLISGSCCAQWHLNTALCDTVPGYDRAIFSCTAIFISSSVWSDLSWLIHISFLSQTTPNLIRHIISATVISADPSAQRLQ